MLRRAASPSSTTAINRPRSGSPLVRRATADVARRHDHPRLLIEVPGGRWHAEVAARTAGFQVLACPGLSQGWSHCPALRGEPCPLAAGADVIVDAQPGQPGRSLLEAHRLLHPSVPVCVELPSEEIDQKNRSAAIPREADEVAVVGFVQRLAKRDLPQGPSPPEGGSW